MAYAVADLCHLHCNTLCFCYACKIKHNIGLSLFSLFFLQFLEFPSVKFSKISTGDDIELTLLISLNWIVIEKKSKILKILWSQFKLTLSIFIGKHLKPNKVSKVVSTRQKSLMHILINIIHPTFVERLWVWQRFKISLTFRSSVISVIITCFFGNEHAGKERRGYRHKIVLTVAITPWVRGCVNLCVSRISRFTFMD